MLSKKRIGRITGSAAGAILGLSPHQTPDDVMRRMVRDYHGAEPEFTGNVATEYGSFHEEGAFIDFEMETGLTPKRNSDFFIHPVTDWIGATPDGFVGDHALIEIKCPYGLRDKKEPEFKSIHDQPHYYAQVQIELYSTERECCFFFQWSPHGTRLSTVDINAKWLQENLPKLQAFYQQYLTEIDNPEHLEPKRKQISTLAASAMIEEYDQLTDAVERATDRKKQIIEELVKLSGGKNCDIDDRKLTLVEKKGSIAYAKAIKKLAPDADLEPWRGKPSSYWRLT